MKNFIATILILTIALLPTSGHAQDNPFAKKWDPIVAWMEKQGYQERKPSGAAFISLLYKVNQSINELKYKTDLWDGWLTPTAFYNNGGGDCEDFAITKMHMLASQGVPLKDMEIWLLEKNRLQSHAVLAVRLNKITFILDNYADSPYTTRELYKIYKPMAALSIQGWRRLDGKP